MRYVRPREYPLNPRLPIDLLDGIIEHYRYSRHTFAEEEALAEVWAAGEDIRLREDPRFWEIAGCGHFHLAHHRLANRQLADRLWQGIWDGHNLHAELEKLDTEEPGTFHVFCDADPSMQREDSAYALLARVKTVCPSDLAARLEQVKTTLLETHRSLAAPRTTRELLDMAIRLDEGMQVSEDAIDHFEGWLSTTEYWAEIARALWLPCDLVPQSTPPKPFHVRPVPGSYNVRQGDGAIEVIETGDEPSVQGAAANHWMLPDPPVEREIDASVRWTHTLRTIHLYSGYLPVPRGARFRYPRFVGRKGPLAIPAIVHETGQEGFIWLDREHHRFFGDFLCAAIEWDEAGRKLHIRWSAEAITMTHGELDLDVFEEERRFLDPEALYSLRLGKGESYRQSLAQILRGQAAGMPFRSLYETLTARVGHRPSRASIRAVLAVSPEFELRDNFWKWRSVPDAVRSLRRTIVLSGIELDSSVANLNLRSLAHAATLRAAQVAKLQAHTPSPHISLNEGISEEPSSHVQILLYRGEYIPPSGTVPLIPLSIAAGGFSAGAEAPEVDGWVVVERRGRLDGMFAAYVSGRSMEPLIPDGALCLFRRNPAGTRQGRIVLVQDRRIMDPDTGGSFTVKRYQRMTEVTEEQSRENVIVHLLPENPDYEPIVLTAVLEGEVIVVAEFVEVLQV